MQAEASVEQIETSLRRLQAAIASQQPDLVAVRVMDALKAGGGGFWGFGFSGG